MGPRLVAGLMAGWAGIAAADMPPMEWAAVGEAVILVYPLAFVTEDEAKLLRGFLTDAEPLARLMPLDGFGAVAMSPDDGLWREGGWVGSVTPVGGMAGAGDAAEGALAGCNARRTGQAGCVVVVEVQPR